MGGGGTNAPRSEPLRSWFAAYGKRNPAMGAVGASQPRVLAFSQNRCFRIEPDLRQLGFLIFFLTMLAHPGFSPSIICDYTIKIQLFQSLTHHQGHSPQRLQNSSIRKFLDFRSPKNEKIITKTRKYGNTKKKITVYTGVTT